MREICVIGGNRYFGRLLVENLRDAGVAVTVVNRGSGAPIPGTTSLVADRDDARRLAEALGDRTFDAVLDQVCYSPVQADVASRVFAGRTQRYVLTSTVEVYDLPAVDAPVAEEVVDPTRWPVRLDLPWHDRAFLEANYGEGKRQAEAVLTRQGEFDVASVRVAHVLGGGPADFTGRLDHYLDLIRRGEPIAVHRDPRPATFAYWRDVADFLAWTADADLVGPVNACATGALTVTRLCERVGAVVGREPRYRVVDDEASPYSFDRSYPMSNARAAAAGFTFPEVGDRLSAAVAESAA